MNSEKDFYRSRDKVPLNKTKMYQYWSWVLFVLSAVTFAECMLGVSEELWWQAASDLGLTCIFLALSTRGEQVAAIVYIEDDAQKAKAIEYLTKRERQEKPWLQYLVRIGWGLMLVGIVMELSI